MSKINNNCMVLYTETGDETSFYLNIVEQNDCKKYYLLRYCVKDKNYGDRNIYHYIVIRPIEDPLNIIVDGVKLCIPLTGLALL